MQEQKQSCEHVRAVSPRSKITPFSELCLIKGKFPGKRIVHCHGVFDVLHVGHLSYFESARRRGDVLVVTVTEDRFVRKGPGRPHFNHHIRANMVAALESVDFVATSPFPTAVPAIEQLRPDVYVKGPDYKDKQKDLTGGIFLEERAVVGVGGQIAFTDDEMQSSSALVNRYFSHWSDEQQRTLQRINHLGGIALIEEVLQRVQNYRVLVVGEPIVDSYVYCQPEALSSKSPAISAKYLYQEDYAGGSLALANHLASFVREVDLRMTHGGELEFTGLLREKMAKNVVLRDLVLPSIPTPRKTRYIDVNTSQRFFEVTNLRSDQWMAYDAKAFAESLPQDGAHQCTLVADFGHGLIEGRVLETIQSLPGFIALNVQTNSSNIGYNFFHKHRRFDFLSLDTREARLACRERHAPILDVMKRIRRDCRDAAIAITLGPDGAVYFPKIPSMPDAHVNHSEIVSPAFADKVVDATGAGDAFFGIASLLVQADCPSEVVPFVANAFAGLATKIVGNKRSIQKAELLQSLRAMLK